MSTRVLVVDDHPIFRDGLVALVDAQPDMHVVGTAADGPDAIATAQECTPDVVLMDLNLPSLSGVEATAAIAGFDPAPAVLVITMVDDDDTVVAALRAGARGYVLKGAPADEVAAAIRSVAAGGAVFGSGVAAQVLTMTSTAQPHVRSPDDGLTVREREVLAMIAEGASNAQIARSLNLSVKTVQNYVSRILDKLQLADRTQAALHARRDSGFAAP
jgi:DNA-binding NarL/FixJ family response regulator